MGRAFGWLSDGSDEGAPDRPPARIAPGKTTLTSRLPASKHRQAASASTPAPAPAAVQADGGFDDPFGVHQAAARGVAGAGGQLPHLGAIQASFGHHDVGGVRAHVGGAAAEAAAAIGARAFATGDDVAFAAAPDLRQAAHEAAHVVQQRGGVRLDGGVGRVGDVYEQHADAVADLVVRGESAQALLDPMAHRGAGGGPAVQRELTAEDRTAARAHVVSDLSMEQIAHRIAYLDGDLPVSTPTAERHRDGAGEARAAGERWTAPRHAEVDALDRTGLHDLGFDTDRLEFFSGQAGLQFWILPARADATVTPIIAFRGTATGQDLAEDTNHVGIGMGQFTMNQAVIESAVRRLGGRHGACATGHSLGGALAQIAACFYPDVLVRVVTFQSPGIPREVVERLRALPPDERPTAMHHRVDGCIVDDAGEDFVAGDVTLHGGPGIDPYTAHTTFPVLAQHASSFPEWMRGSYEHDIGVVTQAGTTADPSFGRALGGIGIAELGRQHPELTGGALTGPLGAAGGHAIRGGVERDEVYARIWLDLLPHADAGDRTYDDLGQQFIMDPCRAQGHAEHVAPMTRNLNQMYPEYPATKRVLEERPELRTDVAAFIAAVRERVGSLSEAQVTRVRAIFHCQEVASAAPVETPPWEAARRGTVVRDRSHDDELIARLRGLEDHHRDE
ncbi:MAG: DUF4157 domain-containing protein [Myxococcales bacterium]|nr:DUF4157 domain-containing protein [Myxococcales bacterium]